MGNVTEHERNSTRALLSFKASVLASLLLEQDIILEWIDPKRHHPKSSNVTAENGATAKGSLMQSKFVGHIQTQARTALVMP